MGESGERERLGESCGERVEELVGERVGGKVGEVGEMEVEIGEFVGDGRPLAFKCLCIGN